MSKPRPILIHILCLLLFLAQPALANPVNPVASLELPSLVGHTEDDMVEVFDEEGNYIFATSIGVHVGDTYINEDNNEYEVIKVDNKRATAKHLGKVDLLGGKGILGSVLDLPPLVQAQGNQEKKIGIYHTHSAESYAPGPAFRTERGQIYDVGEQFKQEFEQKGVRIVQSEETFLPHDGGAYDRSRRTAVELLQQNPDAVFDLHRDAIPRPEEYLTQVNGQEVSKVRLVVGRQNPNMAPNDEMAKRLKAIADEKYPGLVKGIFYAKGKYNQELSPRSLLLEMGTHVTTKEQAQASTTMVVDSIYTMLYGGAGAAGGGEAGTDRAQNTAGWRNLIWVVLLVVVGAGAFLFLNEGGVKGVSDRLKNFTGEEFANVLGRNRKGRSKSSSSKEQSKSQKSSSQKQKRKK